MSVCCANSTSCMPYWAQSNVSDPNWEKVVVLKKDREGNYQLDPETHQPRKYHYLKEVQTGDLYNDEDPSLIANKCAMIFLGTPLYTLGVMIYNFIKIPVDIVQIAWNAIKNFGEDVAKKGCGEASLNLLKSFFWEIPKASVLDLWNIVKAPFFGISIMPVALYGSIWRPLEARKIIAIVESAWKEGISYKEDFRYKKDCTKMNIPDCFANWWQSKAAFLAYCFQVRGNVHQSNIEVLNS